MNNTSILFYTKLAFLILNNELKYSFNGTELMMMAIVKVIVKKN